MIPTGQHRVIQIHPALRCNLRCLHCYSSSGPEESDALPVGVACSAVRDAGADGYQMLAVSGGEPLLYEGLNSVLDAAHEAGMGTSVTTNGTLLTRRRLSHLTGRLDLLTISLDGVPDSHDRIRNSESSFRRLEQGLPALRESGIRFGFIFTLTQHNVHELDWVAHFAFDQGAALLQIHPLELAGRARSRMAREHPDSVELGFAFAESLRLREKFRDRMLVHVDVATRTGFRGVTRFDSDGEVPTVLSEAVSPLVIEADGTVVPLTYGFPRDYALGNLYDAPLRELGPRWLADGFDRYRSAVSRLHDDDVWPDRLPVLNLYETAISLAQSEASPAIE